MGRNKKTRQQKVIADLRRQISSAQPESTVKSPPTISHKEYVPATQPSTFLYSHTYLRHDLLKTISVTAVLLGIEVLLVFLSQKHIISLPV